MASTNATHAATLRQLLTEKTTSAQAKTAGG
jgi:hypothetical protein